MIEAKDLKGKRLDLSDFIPVKIHSHQIFIITAARRWCLQYSSEGKFTFRWNTLSWYFEKEEDAVLFALIWL